MRDALLERLGTRGDILIEGPAGADAGGPRAAEPPGAQDARAQSEHVYGRGEGRLSDRRQKISVRMRLCRFVETALRAFADEPMSVIVTTAALDPNSFEAPHDRVRITRFLPHAEVIAHVDLVVTHGGMGTTQRALAAGVPVVVVPWGRDQFESARRAEVSGAGTLLLRRDLSA